MGKIGLIIQREYLTRVKKRSFVVMTFLGPLLMVGIFVAAIWMSVSESTHHRVLVVDKTPGEIMHDRLKNTDDFTFFYSNQDLSDEAFIESEYSLMLYINEKVVETNTGALYYKETPSMMTTSRIQDQIENIIEEYKLLVNDISPEAYAHVNTNFNLASVDIESKEEQTYIKELSGIGFFFAFIIYLSVLLYGVQVMRGVIEEKTSRIVEVIVSSVKPFELMMGKILGIALVGLTQFALWIILTTSLVTLANGTILKDKFAPETLVENQLSKEVVQDDVVNQIELSDESEYIFGLIDRINFPFLIGMFIFYFLGGYLLYASMFAAVGAAVDSETDTQQFMLPITLPLIFSLIVGEMAILNPEGPATFWFSIIPFTSPIVMMLRITSGFASGEMWQLFLSMALLVGTFILMVWGAGKIYRTGILMYGKKVSYKELWKWIRHH